jgi:hypothetical protein
LLKEDDLNAHLLNVKTKDDSLKEDDKDIDNLIRVVYIINHVVSLDDAIDELNTLNNEPKH